MNLGRQNRPVGRGALLQQLAANAAASSSANSDESRSNTSTSNESLLNAGTISSPEHDESGYSSTFTTGRPQGRGQLLQRILHANESISTIPFNLETAPKPYGSGRGRMLKMLNETNQPAETRAHDSYQSIDEGIERLSIGSEEEEPVIRKGTKGRNVEIMTNYLPLDFDSSKGVFEYEVRFKPDVHAMSLRHRLLNQHRSIIGNTSTFDGVVMYLPARLSDITELISVSPSDSATYHVKIIFKRKKRMRDCIHLYNILFDRIMKKLEYVRIGRKKFDPTAPKIIPQHKLEVWPGYVTAVDEYENGVMLNLDVSHRLLCTTTVRETLTHIYISDKENLRQLAITALLGSVVITRYNNKTYRIDDIDWDSSPNSTFVMNGRSVSYIEYYKSHYNIDIMDEKQPMLISRVERRVAGQAEKETITFSLVPEICYLTGITDEMRSDQKVMRDIATITRVTPEQRMAAYKKFCDTVNNSAEAREILQNWGLSLGTPRKIIGRQLDNETITFGNGKCVAERGDFNRYMTNHNMLKVIDLKDWLIIYTRKDERAARSFTELMERNARPMGMNMCQPRAVCLPDAETGSYVKMLRSSINSSLQIIVCICPSNRDDRYAAIKKICCYRYRHR